MRLVPATLLAAGLSLAFLAPAGAWEGGGHRSGFSHVDRGRAAGWHAPRSHRRWIPALEADEPTVRVVIQQVFVTAPPPGVLRAPTVLDLPVQVGIREVPAVQPAVIVVNDAERPETTASIGRQAAGPKIIDLTTPELAEARPAFGARIIHLAVPVGRAP